MAAPHRFTFRFWLGAIATIVWAVTVLGLITATVVLHDVPLAAVRPAPATSPVRVNVLP